MKILEEFPDVTRRAPNKQTHHHDETIMMHDTNIAYYNST